jgi:simple sugar transport system substrate-binding protein
MKYDTSSKRRRLSIITLLLGVALITAACSSASSSATSTKSAATTSSVKGTFYELYQSCPSNPFWVAVNNGGRAAAAVLGVKLKTEDPLKCTGEIAAENSLLTTIINSHPAGIAVSVVSPTALSANIKRARALHIPIIAYNSLPHDNNYSINPVEGYVGQPNYTAGQDFGKKILATYNLHAGQTIMVADNCYINVTCDERWEGMKSVVAPHGITVNVLNLDYNIPTSAGIVKSYLQTKGKPALVFAIASAGEQAVVEAAQALHYTPSTFPPMVGFDDDPVTNTYMKEGWVKMTDDQQPFLQGFDALVDLYDAVKYHAHPINMSTGPVFFEYNSTNIAKGYFKTSVVKNTGI